MGLFSHKKHDTAPTDTGVTGTHHDSSLTGTGHHTSTGHHTGPVGASSDRDFAHEGTRTGLTGTHDTTGTHHGAGALTHDRRDDGLHDTTGTGHHSTGHHGPSGLSGTGTTGHHTSGMPTDPHSSTVGTHGGGVPPAAHGSGGSGAGKALEGKIEKGLGTVLGSTSLKARGLEKEREAEMIKVQAAELEHAETLEAQARQARERAVASGAHPGNRTLGGGHTSEGHHGTGYGEQYGQQPGMGPGVGGNPVLGGTGQARGSAF